MGQLIEGVWSDEEIITEIKDGYYVKNPSIFRNRVTADGSSGFEAESGRYHLYSSIACPWAHRAVLLRAAKNLEGAIALHNTVQNPDGGGWWFEDGKHRVPGLDAEISYLHELYALADPNYSGKVTVPTLWDAKKKTVVNNESSEIIRMFNSEFEAFAGSTADFYPEELRAAIDEMNELILWGVNDGVNGCGRVTDQAAYDDCFDRLFSTLDKLEEILSSRRYLCGDRVTESDWRLYPTLVRFDSIYYLGYKCNKKRIEDYPNLSNYTRDLFQLPGIADVSDVQRMKELIYRPGGPIPTNGVVPRGPELDFRRPHDRDRFASAA